MKVLIDIPLFFPDHCSGGEATMYDIAKYLQQQGEEVRILLDRSSVNEYDGIRIYIDDHTTDECWKPHYEWCDIIISHLGKIGMSYNRSVNVNKPFVYYQHNSNHCATVEAKREIKVIYNSEWIKAQMAYENESIICRPIPLINFNKTENGKYITLINANENKGVTQAIIIAQRMPDYDFLFVKGAYGNQHINNLPPNIKVIENSVNIAEVYEQTKILICPSLYESWGRVATEAMSCGIPIICSYAKGLRENCGANGIYIERNDIDNWIETIKNIEKNYPYYSNLYKKRHEEMGNDYLILHKHLHLWQHSKKI